MGLFHFDTPQKVMRIGHIEVGGQPGERPPVLMANMFQTGHKLVESRKPPRWNKAAALDEILHESEAIPVARPTPELWDGKAAARILDVLQNSA